MRKLSILFCLIGLSTFANFVFCQTTSVLFLGNSYTYYNGGLPEMFKQVATSMGATVEVESNAPGGYTFANHTTNTTSLDLIASRDWNYVVLQEQSQMPSFPPSQVATDVYPFAAILCDSIQSSSVCTVPLFFMTWGRKNGDADNCPYYTPLCTYDGMQWRLRQSYVEMAEDNDAWVAPVGMAFKSVITSNPEIELYSGDESHPSYCGTYLAACTFYSVIFNESPVGAYIPTEITSDQAAILQNAAWNVVMDTLDTWRIDTTTVRADFEPMFLAKSVQAQFENYSENADSCYWDFGDGTFEMQYPIFEHTYNFMYHLYPAEAEYNICLVAYKDCTEAHACKTRYIFISNDSQLPTDAFSVYPNPAVDGKLNVVNSPKSTCKITDMLGKTVLKAKIINNTVDISSLKPGNYILECGSESLKFIVE